MTDDHPALDLAVTIRHDGHSGVADDLADTAGLTRWVRAHADVLRADLAAGPFAAETFTADAAALAAAVEVRTAVRALFARAVLPGPPSPADAGRLPSATEALGRLNAAAALVPVTPRLDWPQDGPVAATLAVTGAPATADLLAAALARQAIAFLAGPDRDRLRACPAPRCVRYFVKDHARQEWCKPSCGNRARVARHHARHRDGA
jgi:predicted RNA-binding Zn ribbon-like protein